ncbi:hypothetical protein [Sphingomonas sp. LT1P40]|uniref:hypothetical protein n=1 Tax=Alteristakelama amylovorans TaxID=3096166 RepID=UPI002FC8D4AC
MALLAMPLAYWGIGEWTSSGRAPRIVAANWDRLTNVVFGYDPHTRCRLPSETTANGFKIARSLSERLCYDFESPRRFVGVYFQEFEGDSLIEGKDSGPPYREAEETIWPEFDDLTQYAVGTRPLLEKPDGRTRAFEVEFVGRKTLKKGRHGHMGTSDHSFVVDRVVRAHQIYESQNKGYAGPDIIIRKPFSSGNPR